METKQDVQLQLLKEVDEICSDNGLSYILIGNNGLNAFLNNTLQNASGTTSIAMPRGDIDRFCDIIETEFSRNRYVEKFNGKYNLLSISFGNRNTTDLNMLKFNNQTHHGIHIKIFPIYQARTKSGTKISYKDYQNRISSIKSSDKKVINRINDILNVEESRYEIDRWEHIQDFSQVRIINATFESEVFSGIIRINVDGVELSLPEDSDNFFKTIFGKNYRSRKFKPEKTKDSQIVLVDKSYESIVNEIMDILMEINELSAAVEESVLKVKDDKPASIKIWKLAQMTDEQIRLGEYFKDKIDYLSALDLNDEKQFKELHSELLPAISALEKYSKFDMTFSIDPRTDALIENVLLMENNEKLVDKLKALSQKEYFVE